MTRLARRVGYALAWAADRFLRPRRVVLENEAFYDGQWWWAS